MSIYLPIAQVSVDLYVLIGLGFGVGLLSGMFGIGGGFVVTPILFFLGIPPSVAVASQSSQVVGTSTSSAMLHFQRRTIDYKMGLILLGGGLVGSSIGVQIFSWMQSLGQIEVFVTFLYIIFLSMIGILMLYETVRALSKKSSKGKLHKHYSFHHLPFKMRFPASRLYISIIPPLFIGAFVGALAAIMGVGGGFILVPAMIYLLGMPTKTVIGTSMFQIIFVSAFATIMHAVSTQAVDILLALILTIASIPGAQIGANLAFRIPAVGLRFGFALVILVIVIRLFLSMTLPPNELYGVVI